jgi:hypothetical protein
LVKYSQTILKQFPWIKEIIPEYVIPFLHAKEAKGLKPTVRGTAYHLEMIGGIQKTDKVFRNVGTALASARGVIPMNAFADNTRHIIKNFDDEERSLEDYIDGGIQYFKDLPNGFKTRVPKWLGQPRYVEVWIEKDTMTDSVTRALRGLDVVIAPNRGWSSLTFIHNNIERLIDESHNNNRKNIDVLYAGDLDPAGWAMDKKITQELRKMDLETKDGTRTTFKRIGVTEEQLDKYNLKHLTNPDPAVIKKFSNPRNYYVKPFREHFGSVFQIELEVLDALPDFDNILREEVELLYDQDIHDEVLSRPEYSQDPNTIRKQVKDELELLIEDLDE